MKYFILPIFILLGCCSVLTAKDAVDVNKVEFKETSDDWIQMTIEMTCQDNPSAEARDKRYVEAVKVKAYVAYARNSSARLYDYYTSEVEIIIMESNEDYNVYFYLPGLIAKRDRLSQPDPDYYYVEVSVGGVVQGAKSGSAAISGQIQDLKVLQSFLAKAGEEAAKNESILMPSYLTPGQFLGRVEDLPQFLRRDPRD
jgi:hypothetical protein